MAEFEYENSAQATMKKPAINAIVIINFTILKICKSKIYGLDHSLIDKDRRYNLRVERLDQ